MICSNICFAKIHQVFPFCNDFYRLIADKWACFRVETKQTFNVAATKVAATDNWYKILVAVSIAATFFDAVAVAEK